MRYEDWPNRLIAFIEESRHWPFVWGENDCLMFVANAACRMTGYDPVGHIRGTYSTKFGALRTAYEVSGGRFAEAFDVLLPYDMVNTGFAQRGDIVAVDKAHERVLTICVGRSLIGRNYQGGWLDVPRTRGCKAWRVE